MSLNVFADIGLPDPETHLTKAKIVQSLSRIIREKGLSQTKFSALLHGQFRGYSMERRFAAALNHDLCIMHD